MEKFNPLEEVALHYIKTSFLEADDEKINSAHKIIISYIRNLIDYSEAKTKFSNIFISTTPLDKIRAILEVNNTPLPPQPKSENFNRKSNGWSSIEDQRLLHGIFKYGLSDWSHIARFVGNSRTRSQCSQRWHRSLNPVICKETWDKEEDERLLSLVKHFGEHTWSKVSAGLKNRTDVQCRYRYQILQRNMRTQQNKFYKDASYYVFKDQQKKLDNTEQLDNKNMMNSNQNIHRHLPTVILHSNNEEKSSIDDINQVKKDGNGSPVPQIPSIVIPIKDNSIVKLPDFIISNLTLTCA